MFASFSYLSTEREQPPEECVCWPLLPLICLKFEQPLKNVCCFLLPLDCVENSLQEDEFAGLSYLLIALRTASKICVCCFLLPLDCVENSLQEDEFVGLSYLLFALRIAYKTCVCYFLLPPDCVENSLQEDEFAGLSCLLFALITASKIWFAVFSYLSTVSRTASRRMSLLASLASYLL